MVVAESFGIQGCFFVFKSAVFGVDEFDVDCACACALSVESMVADGEEEFVPWSTVDVVVDDCGRGFMDGPLGSVLCSDIPRCSLDRVDAPLCRYVFDAYRVDSRMDVGEVYGASHDRYSPIISTFSPSCILRFCAGHEVRKYLH